MQPNPTIMSEGSTSRALAVAFATTTAMWLLSYVAMLQPGSLAGEAIFIVTLLVLCAGAALGAILDTQCHSISRAVRRGLEIGFISACINLMLVGSLVGGSGDVGIWFIGLFGASLVLGAVGGLLGGWMRSAHSGSRSPIVWHGAFAAVCAVLTFLMLVSGGIVTGFEAGLAVPDWPNSYGHNMLLYPLSEMVADLDSGIFYEHAHRLTGMFVGLASMTLCIVLWGADRRTWVGILGSLVLLMVIGQGVLGGLRVTGVLTMSAEAAVLSPSTALGIVHGVFGQIVFAFMVFIAAITSTRWLHGPSAEPTNGAGFARFLAWALLIGLVLQLIIGAMYRHLAMDLELDGSRTNHLLMAHIALAALVMLLAIINGVRAIGSPAGGRVQRRIGIALCILVTVQVLLGVVATVVVLARAPDAAVPVIEVIITSAHQANGGLLLAAAVLLTAWQRRLEC
ncbi:MAG: COX15/CtaA family protein [Phycisphaerales bacterium]|nr:COX15/CtaA family protein [Phycisphaerales bacterium]